MAPLEREWAGPDPRRSPNHHRPPSGHRPALGRERSAARLPSLTGGRGRGARSPSDRPAHRHGSARTAPGLASVRWAGLGECPVGPAQARGWWGVRPRSARRRRPLPQGSWASPARCSPLLACSRAAGAPSPVSGRRRPLSPAGARPRHRLHRPPSRAPAPVRVPDFSGRRPRDAFPLTTAGPRAAPPAPPSVRPPEAPVTARQGPGPRGGTRAVRWRPSCRPRWWGGPGAGRRTPR